MTRGYTTIEQSKHLVELGLNPSTADMCYPHFIRGGADTYNETPEIAEDIDYPYEMPCWSLTALLDVLKTRKDCNFIKIHSSYSLKWILNTSYYELANWKEKEAIEETLIDTVYNMVVWLIEQGHIIKVNK